MLKGTVKSHIFKGIHHQIIVETRVVLPLPVSLQLSDDKPVFNHQEGEKIECK